MVKAFARLLLSAILFFPLISRGYLYAGKVNSCVPNAGITYVNGYVYSRNGTGVNGVDVVFSTLPDGPVVASVISGPHTGYPQWAQGFFSHILGANGPRGGTWYFWLRKNNQRISDIIILHTDTAAGTGKCQQGDLQFREY